MAWSEKDWHYEKLLPIIDEYKKNGTVSHRWSCGNTQKILINDRVFLIKRGSKDGGIFGSGHIIKKPFSDIHYDSDRASKGEEALFVEIKFDYLVDPKETIIIHRQELEDPEYDATVWNTQGSGRV